jgi:integrase
MRQAGEDRHGLRARALIIVLWRAALRIQEALALTETDLDANRCSVLVQHGKGGHRREVGMDMWAWGALRPWLTERKQLPVGPLFCVIDGPTRRLRPWSSAAVRAELRRLAREGVPLPIPQRQLGHRNMATTSTYLSGIGTAEVIATVASRPAPTMSATAGLQL